MALRGLKSRVKNQAKRAVAIMDRPGLRPVLGVTASAWATLKYRRACRVRWSEGLWLHAFSDLVVPAAELGAAPAPGEVDEVFTHGYQPRSGDVVFDVGAGVGAETVRYSQAVGPSGRVVSIEAHPATFCILRRLCEVNHLDNVTLLEIAAADHDGVLLITDVADHLTNSVIGTGVQGSTGVKARRLDAVTAELGLDHIDLLKMNIEGAEVLALPGLGDLIARTNHVCISCHDFLADESGRDDMRTRSFVERYLVNHGFSVSSRQDASKPWARDYLYGTRRSAAAAA
jgi:FkbM family methyltransferase